MHRESFPGEPQTRPLIANNSDSCRDTRLPVSQQGCVTAAESLRTEKGNDYSPPKLLFRPVSRRRFFGSNRFTTRKNIVAIGKFVQEKGMSLTLLTSTFYLQKVGRDSRSLYGYLLSVIH